MNLITTPASLFLVKKDQIQKLIESYNLLSCAIINDNAYKVIVKKNQLALTLTIPFDVGQLFLDAVDSESGDKSSEWFDYYEDTKDSDYETDLNQFLNLLAAQEVKISDDKKSIEFDGRKLNMFFSVAKTKDLQVSLTERFVPFMERKGFTLDSRTKRFMVFRKSTSNKTYVLEVQWEKHGKPRFILNFGSCDKGETLHLDGKRIKSDDVLPQATSNMASLKPKSGPTTASWFRQDRTFLERVFLKPRMRPTDDVVSEVINLFSEAESYLSSSQLGPHIHLRP